MIRRYALWGSCAKLGAVILLAVLTGIGSQVANAQGVDKPELPTVSLTGGLSNSGWETNYYPDGRIWVPRRGSNGERILLVPVFIKNCWRSTSTYEAFPIYSFKMKFQFDSTALEYVGVERNGLPVGPQGRPTVCLAKDFEFASHVARDTTFQRVIDGPLDNRLRGKRVLITGISSKPLPQTGDFNTPCDQRPFTELFYLKFRVVADPASRPVSARTPIILTNDTLFYNDFQVGVELPFPNDPVPGRFAGLAGPDNYYLDQFNIEQIRDPLRPHRPGMIWVEATDEIPRLSFTTVADRAVRIADSVDLSNNSMWYVKEPITIDSGSNYQDEVNGVGTRDIDVINATPGTRLYYLRVQSDKKWLTFKSFRKGGPGETDPFITRVREGIVPFLDKGILGTTLGVTPQNEATELKRDLNMRIIVDPAYLMEDGVDNQEPGEYAGIYVGYLTFESSYLDVSPVKLKVTAIWFRPPFESEEFDENNDWQKGPKVGATLTGIAITVRNSNQPPDQTLLVMGVGARARDSVDTLFGETVYRTGHGNSFGARWYPKDPTGKVIYENGLGDLWAYTFISADGKQKGPKAASRDIRDIYTDSTLQFLCRFKAGSALNYPVVVSWDVGQFIDGSDLFIRDTLNGSRFNVNMRTATSIGGDRRSFTIRDADIEAFVIEYTLPKVMPFPVINKGWNLLSLPVNPSSSIYSDIFRRATNIPIRFSQNIYQPSTIDLQPGVGYFVKYANLLDRTIAGVRIKRIDENTYPVKLYEGWNTIGSLSYRTSIENISLVSQPGSTGTPEIKGDIYRYVTDRGYQAVTEILPGLGYWMKIQGDAFYVIEAKPPYIKGAGVNFSAIREGVTSTSTNVSVTDRVGRNASLYLSENKAVEVPNVFELPPLPPAGLFDVRFSNQSYVEESANPTINLQGASFPVTITLNNPTRSYTAINPVSGEILGTIKAGTTGNVQLTDATMQSVRLMGQDANVQALNVNVTPNPMSNAGSINVNVPTASTVTVEVYNSVGELVETVFNGTKAAGIYPFEFNTASMPSGRYIVKVISNGIVATSAISIVR